MTTIHTHMARATLFAALAFSLTAAQAGDHMAGHNMPSAPAMAPSAGSESEGVALTEGVIRKVDASAKKITIKHDEIKNLEMPGMTMVFQVKDESMLSAVKAGDKVRFRAEKQSGALVVVRLEVVQ